jgi:dihydrofolate reductase
MADLVYIAITSLDGYIADADGNFDWAEPDEEVHAYVNDLERPAGTHLYGRRMYDVMKVWETLPTDDEPRAMADYATLWKAADKVVYSTTLTAVETSNTRLERTFDPDAVRAMKQSASQPLAIGGAGIARHALAAGLVDVLHQLVNPVVVGGGTGWLPDGLHLPLTLVDEHRFTGGVVHLEYRPREP